MRGTAEPAFNIYTRDTRIDYYKIYLYAHFSIFMMT